MRRQITNLPDYVLNPPPNPTLTVRAASNPFDLVVIADRIYVTDGGRNLVWQVDGPTGASSPLVEFPTVPNPAFPTIGGPFVEAVPTGITTHAGQLFVTLFRGFPFPAGTSSVEQIDPTTGSRGFSPRADTTQRGRNQPEGCFESCIRPILRRGKCPR